jgi:hypothetical protein
MVGASFTVAAVAQVLRSKKGIQAVGNAQISTAQSKFGGASALFDGTTDYLLVSPTTDFAFGTNAFTVELWFRRANTSGTNIIYDGRAASGFSDNTPVIYTDGSTVYYYQGANRASTTFSANTWYHVAITRSGDDHKFWVDGTQIGSTYTNSGSVIVASTLTIGADQASGGGALSMNGYIDEIRVSNSARYTATFTPSTTPFTNDANTVLLMHCSGTNASTFFEDDNGSGRSALGVSAVGNTQISTTQSKFGGTSANLDGTGDGLTVSPLSSFAGSGTFTYEGWFYFTSISGANRTLFDLRGANGSASSMNVFLWDSKLQLYQNTFYDFGGSWSTNTWYHIAITRSGSTYKAYQNGTALTTVTASSGSLECNEFNIGIANDESSHPFVGYIDEIRVSNNVRYSSNFTAPTAPFVNDANTLLLIHADGTSASQVFRDDNGEGRSQRGIQAIGNAQISTTQSKFGTSSLYANSGGYARAYNVQNFGTGNFTIEAWVRPTASASGNRHIMSVNGAASGLAGIAFYHQGTSLRMYASSNGSGWDVFSDVAWGTISDNTWYHLAVVREGTSFYGFVNGTKTTIGTSSATLTSSGHFDIGAFEHGSVEYFTGYIDEVRVSNIARYNANFTAPTEPFQSDANTVLLLHMDGTNASTVFIDDNGIAPYTP